MRMLTAATPTTATRPTPLLAALRVRITGLVWRLSHLSPQFGKSAPERTRLVCAKSRTENCGPIAPHEVSDTRSPPEDFTNTQSPGATWKSTSSPRISPETGADESPTLWSRSPLPVVMAPTPDGLPPSVMRTPVQPGVTPYPSALAPKYPTPAPRITNTRAATSKTRRRVNTPAS